jgi:hypothetical protein
VSADRAGRGQGCPTLPHRFIRSPPIPSPARHRAYLWFFKIARLRLDPAAYSALRGGPTGEELGGISGGGGKLTGLPPAAAEGGLN